MLIGTNPKAAGQSIYDRLEDILRTMSEETALLAADRHVQPDFHGNRAPLAGPTRKGTIASYHERKYRVFREMQDDFAKYHHMMTT